MNSNKNLRPFGILFLFLLISANLIISLLSAAQNSITMDEVVYLSVGHLIVQRELFYINPEQPPFPKVISAIFSSRLNPRLPESGVYVSQFWRLNREIVHELTLWGRVPIIILGPILILLCYFFAARLYGVRAGLLAAFFASLEPSLVAHQKMITGDYPFAVFILASLILFSELFKKFRFSSLLALGLSIALAFASKFTAVLLIPYLVLGLLILSATKESPFHKVEGIKFFPRLSTTQSKLIYGALILLASAIIAFFVIWALYNFRIGRPVDSITRGTSISIQRKIEEGDRTTKALLPWLYKNWPAPEYVLGLFKIAIRAEGHPAYFLGKISETGWPAYYPFTFLVKTSIPLLILFFISAIIAIFNFKKLDGREIWLWLCWLFGMAFFINSKVDLGVRYILFLYPISIVLMSKLAVEKYFSKQAVRLAISTSAIWLIVANVKAFPNYISYFNELVGGSKNGWRYLADSNLDWGQGLIQLKQLLDKHPEITNLHCSYFGAINPEYYGIKCDYLYAPFYVRELEYDFYPKCEPIKGWLAISVNNYLGIYFDNPNCYAWLRNYAPLYRVSDSIWIYRIE